MALSKNGVLRSMTDTPRSWKRPVEEVAIALAPIAWSARGLADTKDFTVARINSRWQAKRVLERLTALGFLTIECLEAIKAEQEGMKP